MTQRILLASLFHETHCFLDEVTNLHDFQTRSGPQLLARRGDGSTLDGFLEAAERHEWSVIPTVEFVATPSGIVDHSVFEIFWERFVHVATVTDEVDGIWVSLHGAMVTTECRDPEGEFLARLRRIPHLANLPVFGVFDLHATLTAAMADHADCLVAYRENPHSDARTVAMQSADLLRRALDEGRRPTMVLRNVPILWPPTGTATAAAPMSLLQAAARSLEAADPDIWSVSVVAGFAFADAPDAGVSVALATTGPRASAESALDSLTSLAWAERNSGLPEEWSLENALDDAARRDLAGLVVIVEPADNIGGGAPGDCTTILRAFLDKGLERAAVVITDPLAVAALTDVEPGSSVRLQVGGRGSRFDPGPVTLEARLVSRSVGRFQLEDARSHLAAWEGNTIDMGPCATLVSGGVSILLTSRKTPPFDLGQLRSQGIVPENLAFIGVKAAVGHRTAYDPICAATYTVSTPGPCASELSRLPYEHRRRPVFPLDDEASI